MKKAYNYCMDNDPRLQYIAPKKSPDDLRVIKKLAKEHAIDAIKAIVEIMNDVDGDPRVRLAAAETLLERGFGKPSQEIQIAGMETEDGIGPIEVVTSKLSIEELQTIHGILEKARGQ